MSIYKENDIINVEVTGIEEYGFFVNVDSEYDGLIHISEISYNFVKNIHDYVRIGEKIKAKVIAVDEDNKHLKLSIKDIDYKGTRNNMKKIKETPLGFSTLSKKLPGWIKEKKENNIKINNFN